MRTAIVAAVSTTDQASDEKYSIPSQLESCHEMRGAIERENTEIGVHITMEEATAPMCTEAAAQRPARRGST